MAAHLHAFKDAEERIKMRMFSALNSALIVYLTLLLLLIAGIIFSRRV